MPFSVKIPASVMAGTMADMITMMDGSMCTSSIMYRPSRLPRVSGLRGLSEHGIKTKKSG